MKVSVPVTCPGDEQLRMGSGNHRLDDAATSAIRYMLAAFTRSSIGSWGHTLSLSPVSIGRL